MVSNARFSRPVLPYVEQYMTRAYNAQRAQTLTNGPASTVSMICEASSSLPSSSTIERERVSVDVMIAASTLSTWCNRCSSAWIYPFGGPLRKLGAVVKHQTIESFKMLNRCIPV